MTQDKDPELDGGLPSDATLELYQGAWAVRCRGKLIRLPKLITREEAERVLELAKIKLKGN